MRVTTTPARIKRPFSALPALVALLGVACAGPTVQAPFPERPDTVRPGSLRGPFDGQVVEAANGNPVSSALVLGSWGFERPGALPGPAGTVTRSVLTRSDGGYELPAVSPPESGLLLSRFTLLVYKGGFLGYRSDQRFEDKGARSDFAQRRLTIRLERFPDGESHARHLVFLGGDAALRRAAQAEVVQAALELTEAQPAPKAPAEAEKEKELPLPEARLLLTAADVQALGKGLQLSSESLADNLTGERPGNRYDGVHYRALGKPETFDAALRIFRPGGAEAAEALLAKLEEALPGAKELPGVGDKALRAFDGKRRVHGAAALLREAGLVVQIACGASLCQKDEAIGKLLGQALGRLAQPAEGERGDKDKGAGK